MSNYYYYITHTVLLICYNSKKVYILIWYIFLFSHLWVILDKWCEYTLFFSLIFYYRFPRTYIVPCITRSIIRVFFPNNFLNNSTLHDLEHLQHLIHSLSCNAIWHPAITFLDLRGSNKQNQTSIWALVNIL